MDLPEVDLNHYQYELPAHRIAQHPLAHRDASKLLVYQQGSILHKNFSEIGEHLPSACTLVFNDTKVIPARLFFTKDTGASIEVFLLNPLEPSSDFQVALQAQGSSSWHCMIGNRKRWKKGQSLTLKLTIDQQPMELQAFELDATTVELRWQPKDITLSQILEAAGKIPLPPYMKRDPEAEDYVRYQTVYSKIQGAVAAPTAGLHFTDSLLKSLKDQGIRTEYLTLHVGAGTFQPIKSEKVSEHPMHGEQIILTKENIQSLMKADNLVAVGTTSLRTLESLFWFGVKIMNSGKREFHIEKLMPYQEYQVLPDFKEALAAVYNYMVTANLEVLSGYTEIFIFPPYQIRSCQGLITNFHLPGSTLILLVAAFVGEDWRNVYREAMENNYRFLSYGDTSLLMRS